MDWTTTLTSFISKFYPKRCEEEWIKRSSETSRRLAYLVRLLNWSYCEGMISSVPLSLSLSF